MTIDSIKDEFLKDLDEFLKIKSVSAEGSEIPQKALEWILAKAESFGFSVKNIENIAGHAEYGDGDILCGVLTHVDVVPANAEEWICEPFALTRKNGRMYGRGVADDKGSALAALYCLRILKQSGICGNRVRVIFGAAEEIGMDDMKIYFQHESLPDMSFTPDSEYGICRAEKGILHIEFSGKEIENLKIKSGTADNVVPDTAECQIVCGESEKKIFNDIANKSPEIIKTEDTSNGIKIIVKGLASHACEPEKGINSAQKLISVISEVMGEKVGFCKFIKDCLKEETNGESLGIMMNDDISGELTLVLSRLNVSDGEGKAVVDIRYPVSFDEKAVTEKIRCSIKKYGVNMKILGGEEPLFLDESVPVVKILKDSYKKVMGSDAKLYTTGGGTYARVLDGKGVAFGPVFEDDDSRIHNSNESIDEEKFFRHFEICLEAMKNMMIYNQ